MNLPRVVITANYTDFLNGKEVDATLVSTAPALEKGMRVMGFHNSIAVNTDVAVPREKQSQYIGVEGMITEIEAGAPNQRHPKIKVIKI